MSFAKAVIPKQSLNELSTARGTLSPNSSQKPASNGLDDFLNELNQATKLRLNPSGGTPGITNQKPNKAQGQDNQRIGNALQILQKRDLEAKKTANIAVLSNIDRPIDSSGAGSDARAETLDSSQDQKLSLAQLLAAIEQLSGQQNQANTNNLLRNWGKSPEDSEAVNQSNYDFDVQNQLMDLAQVRNQLHDLGFSGLDSYINNLDKALSIGDSDQIDLAKTSLTEQLLATQLELLSPDSKNSLGANVLSNQQSSDIKNLLAIQLQKNQIVAKQLEAGESMRDSQQKAQLQGLQFQNGISAQADTMAIQLVSVELDPSKDLKSMQATDLDREFISAQGDLLKTLSTGLKLTQGEKTAQGLTANMEDLRKAAAATNVPDGFNINKVDGGLQDIAGDDFSSNLLSASQVAQGSTNISSTPTQIAMSLQETSVTSGPLHSEILNAARSGGGRIQLELTPPEQGTIRIDLRIDQSGRAYLIVEGANDAAKARLDQGGQQLKNEFAQMGLQLSLDLRQGDSRFAQNQQFGSEQSRFAQPSSSTARSSMGIGLLSESLATTRFLSDNASGVSGIHLYA
jgi:hypothetical protein